MVGHVFIFFNFQEPFDFLFYFINDPLIVEQCIVQLPVVCIFSAVGLKLFSFSAWKTSLHDLLSFNVSVQKSAVILMGLPLYVMCFFSYCLQYSSLVSVLVVLMIACCGVVLFWSGLFSVLEASCT
jgi:hypothetical protein